MKPFERGQLDPETTLTWRDIVEKFGCTKAEAKKQLREVGRDEIWLNDQYQVNVRRDPKTGDGWPDMIWLSIKTLDKQPVHDWRDMQEIKNQLVGQEHEGIELYPAESRLVDTANQYHMWVLAEPGVRFPFGFPGRAVSSDSVGGAVQRPRPQETK